MTKHLLIFGSLLVIFLLPGYFIAELTTGSAPLNYRFIAYLIIQTPIMAILFWLFSTLAIVGAVLFLKFFWMVSGSLVPKSVSDWKSFSRPNKLAQDRQVERDG